MPVEPASVPLLPGCTRNIAKGDLIFWSPRLRRSPGEELRTDSDSAKADYVSGEDPRDAASLCQLFLSSLTFRLER